MSLDIRIVDPFSPDRKVDPEVYTVRFVKEWINQIHICNEAGEGIYMTDAELFGLVDKWFKKNMRVKR